MEQAKSLDEIDQAVQFNTPIDPDHPFFTNFEGLRGTFEEAIVYKCLNVKRKDSNFTFDYKVNSSNKTLLFLGGMRGSGKTSELAKYAKHLHTPSCFFCVTCNIDDELDMDNVEYMDILIFQLEKLASRLKESKIKISEAALKSLNAWFEERITEIITTIKGEAGLLVGFSSEKSLLSQVLGLFGELKVGVSGTKERATKIRSNFKNRFNDFALKFNEFVEEANSALRKESKGQEVLFIIDGLEKTLSLETRRKILLEESNRIRQIHTYTIFTLPIELMKERQRLTQFSRVESFPFVKLLDQGGKQVETAFLKFKEFIGKRVDKTLFESDGIIEEIIQLSGGSPRELLRILETTAFYADETKGKIDVEALNKAKYRLASQTSQHLTEEQLNKLKELKENNEKGLSTPYDDVIQELLEQIIVMEYNDGNNKRVNPLVKISKIYGERVG